MSPLPETSEQRLELNIVKVRSHVSLAYLIPQAMRRLEEQPKCHPNGLRAVDVARELDKQALARRPVGSTEKVERVPWRDVYDVLSDLARMGAIHEVKRCRPHGARATPRFRTIGG